MSGVVAAYITPDEPCYGGFEGPLMRTQKDGSQDWRWCQVVRVIRGDEKAEYMTDLGPAEDFELVTPIMVPSFGENKVGHVLELLERNRYDTYWQTRAKQMQAESTLIQDHIRQYEQIQEIIRNRSTFGPTVKVQRNGWDHHITERRVIERRKEKTGIIPHRRRG